MRKLLLVSLLFSSYAANAEREVKTFDCVDLRYSLEASGTISQSESEPWRFFLNVKMSNGAEERIEARSYTGYEVDGSASFSGYWNRGVIDYVETNFRDKPDTIELTIKKKSLTGDDLKHKFNCEN